MDSSVLRSFSRLILHLIIHMWRIMIDCKSLSPEVTGLTTFITGMITTCRTDQSTAGQGTDLWIRWAIRTQKSGFKRGGINKSSVNVMHCRVWPDSVCRFSLIYLCLILRVKMSQKKIFHFFLLAGLRKLKTFKIWESAMKFFSKQNCNHLVSILFVGNLVLSLEGQIAHILIK